MTYKVTIYKSQRGKFLLSYVRETLEQAQIDKRNAESCGRRVVIKEIAE